MANNPYVNKVVKEGTTLIDLSADTALAADVAQGKYFHLATGERVAGTASGGGGAVIQDQDGFLVLSDQGGGSSGDAWNWMGKNPTKVQTFTAEHKKFSETDFATWTFTTSQTTIRTGQDYSPTVMLDLDSYDYLQIVKFYIHYDYGSWTPVCAISDFSFIVGITARSTYSTTSAAQSEGAKTGCTASEQSTSYQTYYYNNSGNISFSGLPYGIYSTSGYSPSISGSNNSARTFTWKTPTIYARGNANYFSETAFNNLDMNASYYDLACEIWRVDAGTSDKSYAYNEAVHILNNGV